MKNRIFIAIMVLMILISSIAYAQYNVKSPSIQVTINNQDPDPVEPGKQFEVNFKIDNEGDIAQNMVFSIMPEYPFSLVPGEVAERKIGVLGNTNNADQSVVLKYKLIVDKSASDGNYEIKAGYKYGDSQLLSVVQDLSVNVQSHDAILGVDKFSADPAVVAPGAKARLSITLKNYATSGLKDIRVSLELGTSNNLATPFSPLGSVNEKVISFIEGGAATSVDFDLLVDPDAASKSYKVPLMLRYSDLLNKNYSKSNVVTMVVGGEPEVSIGIDSTTIYTAGAAGDVTVKIVNRGLPDMKFVNLKLLSSDKYKTLSPSEIYIGNIDSDDYETADFKLYMEKTSDKSVAIPLTVEYKDANNKNYKKDISLSLPLYTSSEAKKLGLVAGNGSSSWFFILIIAVAAFFGYRMWKKKRK